MRRRTEIRFRYAPPHSTKYIAIANVIQRLRYARKGRAYRIMFYRGVTTVRRER